MFGEGLLPLSSGGATPGEAASTGRLRIVWASPPRAIRTGRHSTTGDENGRQAAFLPGSATKTLKRNSCCSLTATECGGPGSLLLRLDRI